jgi:hypothetical protein
MDNQERIAGGFFIFVLMFFLLNPLNNDMQAAAAAPGAAEWVIAFAPNFQLIWVGLMFIVLAFTGYDVLKSIR